MNQPNLLNDKSILCILNQVVGKCVIIAGKPEQIKRLTQSMERCIKVNQLFGFAVLAPYFKLLGMSEQPCYDIFDALIQVNSSEMNL